MKIKFVLLMLVVMSFMLTSCYAEKIVPATHAKLMGLLPQTPTWQPMTLRSSPADGFAAVNPYDATTDLIALAKKPKQVETTIAQTSADQGVNETQVSSEPVRATGATTDSGIPPEDGATFPWQAMLPIIIDVLVVLVGFVLLKFLHIQITDAQLKPIITTVMNWMIQQFNARKGNPQLKGSQAMLTVVNQMHTLPEPQKKLLIKKHGTLEAAAEFIYRTLVLPTIQTTAGQLIKKIKL